MGLSKKFTPEFFHYLRNGFICSTHLFGKIVYRAGDATEKHLLASQASLSVPVSESHTPYPNHSLRVLSYNIMKTLNETAIFACFDSYRQQGFDILLLQEVIIQDGKNRVQEYFTKHGFYTYFHPTARNAKRTKVMNYDFIGVMVVSRYSITYADFLAYDLVRPHRGWYHGEVYFGLGYARISLADGRTIGLYSTHSEWFTRPSGRAHQTEQAIRWISSHDNDIVIVGGDFNSWLPLRFEKLPGTFESQGFHYFKNRKPFASLDHIWIRGAKSHTDLRVGSSGSDHTAIACDVML